LHLAVDVVTWYFSPQQENAAAKHTFVKKQQFLSRK
jgi:hypothetical protein